MTNRKKSLVRASLICTAAFNLFTAVPTMSYAAYQLNSEVKDATLALLEASEIGVRVHETPSLQNSPNKDAILVMSFGTTFKDTREKTIEATVKEIQTQHPNTKVELAFTSHIIIDRIKANECLTIPTPEEALTELKKEGYSRVALVSLDIIPGMEYNYKKGVYNLYKNDFKKMTLSTPLMYWQGQEGQENDIQQFLGTISTQFPKQGKHDAVLIMAHGTPDPSNSIYSAIQANIDELGLDNVYVYTVEGWPSLENVVPKLKARGIKNITLMPMMMVAGDHANNDMAGAEPDSHKSILEKEGFKVSAYLHGLGENAGVREIFVNHANEAWNALEASNIHESAHQKAGM